MRTLIASICSSAVVLCVVFLSACGARTEAELITTRRDAGRDGAVIDVMDDRQSVADVPSDLPSDVPTDIPTAIECQPETVRADCTRVFGLRQDPEAVFACCNGRCAGGDCSNLCGDVPCDPHFARVCCFSPEADRLLCGTRDRGYCGYAPPGP